MRIVRLFSFMQRCQQATLQQQCPLGKRYA